MIDTFQTLRQEAEHNYQQSNNNTSSPPIKSSDFRGFDASRLLILKGGNSHVRRTL